ncbi:MAG: M3 family oligoendopeptidase [Anaerolineae bacterium]|nr:M3 family oligoendopeptidase [Anaerolineae bacterium]
MVELHPAHDRYARLCVCLCVWRVAGLGALCAAPAGTQGFAERYLEALRSGGSAYPHHILAPLGVDLSDPTFWTDGLALVDGFLTETEQESAALTR